MDTAGENRSEAETPENRAASGELWGSVLSYAFGEPRNAVSAALLDASSATHAAAADLSDNQRRETASLVDHAAEWLGSLGRRLLRTSPDEAVDVVSEAARARPALYLAGAVATGAAVALWFQYQSTSRSTGAEGTEQE